MAETYQLAQVTFGDATMSQAHIFEWVCCFKEGWISVKSVEHPGCLSTNRNDESVTPVYDLMQNDKDWIN